MNHLGWTLTSILAIAGPGLRAQDYKACQNDGFVPCDRIVFEDDEFPSRWKFDARAAAIKKLIVEQRVDAARLTPKGYGAARPLAQNTSPANKANNRRVEFTKR